MRPRADTPTQGSVVKPEPAGEEPKKSYDSGGIEAITHTRICSRNTTNTSSLLAHVSSLQEDVATKNEFKYNLELERIACNWVSKVLEEECAPSNFIAFLKSGVKLCQYVTPSSYPSLYIKIKIN